MQTSPPPPPTPYSALFMMLPGAWAVLAVLQAIRMSCALQNGSLKAYVQFKDPETMQKAYDMDTPCVDGRYLKKTMHNKSVLSGQKRAAGKGQQHATDGQGPPALSS